MLTAIFFQRHNDLKRTMDKKFKAAGYNLTQKRRVLAKVLGYVPKLGDMKLGEMEEVIYYLDGKILLEKDEVKGE